MFDFRPKGFTLARAGLADRFSDADLFDGVSLKRTVAFIIDMVIVGVIYLVAAIPLFLFNALTFGLFSGLTAVLWAIGPLLYSIGFILTGSNGTPGMRAMGVEVRGLDNQPPVLLQAVLHVGLYWATVIPTAGLILIVGLMNSRGRLLHDYVSGLILLPGSAIAGIAIDPGRPGSADFRSRTDYAAGGAENRGSVVER